MDDKKQCHQLIPECASLLCDLIIGANFPNPSQSMMDTVRTLPISQISHCGCSSGSASQILSLMSLISDLTTPAAPRPWLSLQTNIFKTKLQFKSFLRVHTATAQPSSINLYYHKTSSISTTQTLKWAHTTNNNICGYLIHILISIH